MHHASNQYLQSVGEYEDSEKNLVADGIWTATSGSGVLGSTLWSRQFIFTYKIHSIFANFFQLYTMNIVIMMKSDCTCYLDGNNKNICQLRRNTWRTNYTRTNTRLKARIRSYTYMDTISSEQQNRPKRIFWGVGGLGSGWRTTTMTKVIKNEHIDW